MRQRKKKRLTGILFLTLLSFFLFASGTFAQTTADELEELHSAPQPRINIPGVTFTDPSKLVKEEEDGSTYVIIPYLGEYLAALYRYAVVIASILAVVVIIFAGIQWIVSAGSSETINSAKKKIGGALIGLLLAVGSYTVLSMVNPELVRFRHLRVLQVKGEPLPNYDKYPDDYNGLLTPVVPLGSENLDLSKVLAYKGAGCGKNLVQIAQSYVGQTICQGPCHCANFVSRVLKFSGCVGKEFSDDSATNLRKKLIAQGWQLVESTEGVKPGDIVFWGNSKGTSGHVEIASSQDGKSIGSSVGNMPKCWGNKAQEVTNTCGDFKTFWYAVDKQTQKDIHTDAEKQTYSQCVASVGVCPPWGDQNPELCGYCAKIGPPNEWFNPDGCASRQCVGESKGKWTHYLRNPNK